MEKKRKLADLMIDVIRQHGLHIDLNPVEAQDSFNKTLKVLSLDWSKLLTSPWFSSKLYIFLDEHDIVVLDTAICNHSFRPNWLTCLRNYRPITFAIMNDHAVDWFVLKGLSFENIVIDYTSKITNDGMFKLAHLCNTKLKSIKIYPVRNLDENGIRYIAGHCPQLQSICLNGFKLRDHTLIGMSMGCRHLNDIKIIFNKDSIITKEGFQGLLENCRNLLQLDLKDFDGSGNRGKIFLDLGENCPLLESLTLDTMTFSGYDEYIQVFTQKCKQLKIFKCLDVHGVISNQLLISLGTSCHLLQDFQFNSNSDYMGEGLLDDNALHTLTQGCPLLHTVMLRCHVISPIGLNHLAKNLSLLSILDLSRTNMTDVDLVEIGKMKNLKHLDLSICNEITDAGVANLLKEPLLYLEWIDFDFCSLTDISCIYISNNCPQLKFINIYETTITAVGVIRLYNHCVLLHTIRAYGTAVPKLVNDELTRRRLALGIEDY